MASTKRLRSVCHSIAHHAVSGLSFVHPHVVKAARSSGIANLEVQLLDDEPCPEAFRDNEPLRRSLKGLKEKFEGILKSEDLSPSDLEDATLTFTAVPNHDDYCSICHAKLAPVKGKPIEYVVNYLGEKVGA